MPCKAITGYGSFLLTQHNCLRSHNQHASCWLYLKSNTYIWDCYNIIWNMNVGGKGLLSFLSHIRGIWSAYFSSAEYSFFFKLINSLNLIFQFLLSSIWFLILCVCCAVGGCSPVYAVLSCTQVVSFLSRCSKRSFRLFLTYCIIKNMPMFHWNLVYSSNLSRQGPRSCL